MDYRSRWYDPALGRFIQPDTIIPQPTRPQSWNRFTYVVNNPMRFNDPTGHSISDCNQIAYLGARSSCVAAQPPQERLLEYGITITSELSYSDAYAVLTAARAMGASFASAGQTPSEAFRFANGPITIDIGEGKGPDNGNCITNYGSAGSTISCDGVMDVGNAVHEFFHVFDKNYQALSTVDNNNPNCDMAGGGCFASSYIPGEWLYDTSGYTCPTCLAHPPDVNDENYDNTEAFANLGQMWVLGGIDTTTSMGKFLNMFMSGAWMPNQAGISVWLGNMRNPWNTRTANDIAQQRGRY